MICNRKLIFVSYAPCNALQNMYKNSTEIRRRMSIHLKKAFQSTPVYNPITYFGMNEEQQKNPHLPMKLLQCNNQQLFLPLTQMR